MEIIESKKGAFVVLAVKGSLDVVTSPALEKRWSRSSTPAPGTASSICRTWTT